MPKAYSRKIIAVRGDTQSGHAGGLLNPETVFPVIAINDAGKKVVDGYEEATLNPAIFTVASLFIL